MRTITITIPDNKFQKLGLVSDNLSFDELFEKISILLAKNALLKCQRIAKKTGISNMTLDDINKEISEARKNA